jgi:hypothetical protein
MKRTLVFALALALVLGFALLTAYVFARYGVTFYGVVALAILLFLSIALIGSMLSGPRE